MGSKAEDNFNSFRLSEINQNNYELVSQKFIDYYEPKKNTIFRWALFNQKLQNVGELADDFITALYSLAIDCNYSSL